MIYGNEPVSDLAGQFPIGLDPSDIEILIESLKKNNDDIKIKPLDLAFSFSSNPGLINFQNSYRM